MSAPTRHHDIIVIGGGQAGLTVGYYLSQCSLPFVILDGSQRIGDAWRERWDSLRLFTPNRLNGLPGMPFPGPAHAFPTKDEMADYLEDYAARFELPVQTGVMVNRLSKSGERFVIEAGDSRYDADNVVVAMATHQLPHVPSFASQLNPDIIQMHSYEYRNSSQLKEGGVLVVGAGNSGAEIAMDVVHGHPTWLSGQESGHIPFPIEGFFARYVFLPVILPFLADYVLTTDTPIGRKIRPKMLFRGAPLVRVKPDYITAAGIERVPRVAGVQDGLPRLEDQRSLDVNNVIWSTGYRPSFSWIDLPVFGREQDPIEPIHERGVVPDEPGLYFVGLWYLYSASSGVLYGIGRDAKYVVEAIAARTRAN